MMNIFWLFKSRYFKISIEFINGHIIWNWAFHYFFQIPIIVQSSMMSHQCIIHQHMVFRE